MNHGKKVSEETIYSNRKKEGYDEFEASDTNRKKNTLNHGKEEIRKCKLTRCQIISIVIITVIVTIAGIITAIILFLKKSDKEKPKFGGQDNTDEINVEKETEKIEDKEAEEISQDKEGEEISQDKEVYTLEEIKKIFEPNFKLKSQVDTLSQMVMKSKQNFITKSKNLLDYTFIKAKFDSYTLSESPPETENESNFLGQKYITSLVINSFCSISEGTDCEYIPYLDLTYEEDQTNLRSLEEGDIEDVILPVCLIEHSETNIIISVSCPSTLEENLKNLIINAFKLMKPVTIRGFKQNKTLDDTTIESKDNKLYVNSFSKICDDGEENEENEEEKDKICETIKNITIKDEYLISSDEKIKTETNSISNEYVNNFENITSEDLNTANYKSHLDEVLNLIKDYMVKDTYVTEDSFKEFLEPNQNEENAKNSRRNLAEERSQNIGAQEATFFEIEYNSLKVSLNLSDNIINDDRSQTLCKIKAGNKNISELSHEEVNSNLTKTISEFKVLINAFNSLANELFNNLDNPLIEVRDKINSEFTAIYNYLPFKDLLAVFDSTFAVTGLDDFPTEIISATKNTYNNIKKISDDLLYIMDDAKTKLKSDISTFISNLHNKIYNIFNNLNELNSALSSRKSKIANIASYYCGLKDSNNTLVSKIEEAKNILDNYYIDEKNLIERELNYLFNNFSELSNNLITNEHYFFNNITNRLEEEGVKIQKGDEDDIKNVIANLYNTKLLENNFVNKIIENMKKNIILSNGYLISQQVIDSNKNSYSPIGENLLNTAENLVNNEYIDEVFDNIMKYYRNEFINILKNIEISKATNFPIKSDTIGNSLSFDDLNFADNQKNIKNWFENENENFKNSTNNKINGFIQNNKANLEKIISDIDNNLSKNLLDSIVTSFEDMLNYTKGNITNILNNNNNLLLAYINDASSSTHLTQTIKNKVNIYMSRINEIKAYIQNNLKIDLINKYKNVITQVRKALQTIKSNQIISKYSGINNLSFLKTHIDTIIDPLYTRLNEKISDENFNRKYLPEINNNIINYFINLINQQIENFNIKYSPLSKKTYSSDSTYDKYYYVSRSCCKRKWYGRKKCYDCSYYSPTNVGTTNNHLSLKNVDFENYSRDFTNKYNEIYNIFSKNINSYNDIINNFGHEMQSIINSYSNKNVIDLNIISDCAKSFINNKLGNNVLILSYDYYKKDLQEKLPIELESILNNFKSLFDTVYEEISTNINKFKYPINEFSDLATIYNAFYSTNISYLYLSSIVDQRRNDLNYTVKYYYNLFISKINNIYSYIKNNVPVNEKPFNNVFDNQISQIDNSYKEIFNLFQTSHNNIINLKNQLSILKVIDSNFFKVNEYWDNIADEIEEKINPYIEKFEEIVERVSNKFQSEESLATRFYLENYENNKQIDEIYETINKGTFIDFQNTQYQELFTSVLEIDDKNLQNKILDFISNSNENLSNSFMIRRQNYKNRLQNELYTRMYNTENIKNLINLMYSGGLNNLDINSKNTILDLINDVINKIEEIMKKEENRLLNSLTSYSDNFDKINNTINNLKKDIFNQFNDVIYSPINSFYSQIKQKFYIDYIENNLNDYYTKTLNEDFPEKEFLNITINLKEYIIKDLESIINEYKKIALDEINYLNKQKTEYLDELFIIQNVKNNINTKIENLYNQILYRALGQIEKYNSGDEGIIDYDFDNALKSEINSKIESNINEAKKIIENKMKGPNYTIIEDWKIVDFSFLKRDLFNGIKNDFREDFYKTYNSATNEEFYKEISGIINNNYEQIIKDFVPSFGKDYFERNLKYNEIQKIESLYSNLKLSIGITLSYYMFLSFSDKLNLMPEDLAKKILSLNEINSIVNIKNNDVLLSLNTKFDNFLDSTKTNLITTYIETMQSKLSLENKFNEKIWDLIKDILIDQKTNFQNIYYNYMNTYIKNPFIENYSKVLREKTNDMLDYIEENREILRMQIEDFAIMNKDDTLNNIETKLNNTSNAIKDYYSYFNFSVSNDIKEFLDNFVKNNILIYHEEIRNTLDLKTKNIILDYLNDSIKDYNNAYVYDNIELMLNKTNNLFKNSLFEQMIQTLKNYGTIEDKYLDNLEKEIIKFSNENSNLRRLDDFENTYNINLQKTFKSLKEISTSIKQYIQDNDLFNNFNDKIKNYINVINDQYKSSKTLIDNRKYTQEVNNSLYQILETLKDNSIKYYTNVKEKYNEIKENIEDSIIKVNNLIDKSIKITYDEINDKYTQMINKYNSINKEKNSVEKIEEININEVIDNKQYSALIIIDEFLNQNQFTFDLKYKDGISTLTGKSINKNRPKSFSIDFSYKAGSCVQKGKKMIVNLNNVSSNINLNFDSSSSQIKIAKNVDFDEYNIHNSFYNETQKSKKIKVGGVLMNKVSCERQELEKPQNEKSLETIYSKNETKMEVY